MATGDTFGSYMKKLACLFCGLVHLAMAQVKEPYAVLHGGDYSGSAVKASPDPLITYRWRAPSAADSLQVYTLHAKKVQGLPAASFTQANDQIRVSGVGDLVFDFGQENAGWLEFDSDDLVDSVAASISEYNEPEIVSDGAQHPFKTAKPIRYGHTYRLELNDQLYEGVRFAWIHVRTFSKVWHIKNVRLICQTRPVNYRGSFSCSDPELTRVWYTGAYVVKLNLLQDYFGAILIERSDRISWTGDAYPAQAAALAAFGNYDVVRKNLVHTAAEDNGIPAYSLYWVLSLIDYYNYTGDTALVRQFLDNADKRLVKAYDGFDHLPNLNFMGWDERLGAGFENPMTPDAQGAYRMLCINAWKQYAAVMTAMGEKALAGKYNRFASEKTQSILGDREAIGQFDVHAISEAINAGLGGDAVIKERSAALYADRQNRLSYSPFNQYFIIQGMATAGRYADALTTISDCWGGQVRYGGTTFFEVYRPSWNAILQTNDAPPNNQCGYTSLAHPWGAGVTKWLSENVLGIRPAGAGFTTFTVMPHLGDRLTDVQGSMPTPLGLISASFNTQTGVCQLHVPAGTVAIKVGLPKAGRQVSGVTVNGQLLRHASEDGDYIYLTDVHPGDYRIRMDYTGASVAKPAPAARIVYPVTTAESAAPQGGGAYGTDGYIRFGDPKTTVMDHLPSYVDTIRLHNNNFVVWDSGGAITTQDAKLTWQTMTIDVRLKADHPYTLSIYCLDRDKQQRRSAIEIFDLETLRLVAPVAMVRHYERGKYVTFTFNKSVRIRIDQVRGKNAAVSGLFFDKAQPPYAARQAQSFLHPPDSVRPGVYWYFMDGNMSGQGMTEDLESMKRAGIGNVLFLEVNVGVPRGPVDYLGAEWQALFTHAVRECERLGIRMTLGIGPGWSGSGGPWVAGAESMQHLVSSTVQVSGPGKTLVKLPLPLPKPPYFGEGSFTPELKKRWEAYYKDVAVLAFPTPVGRGTIPHIDEKALYYREPFSSKEGVKPFLPSYDSYPDTASADIPRDRVLDLTGKLRPDGTLDWVVPAGDWTIMRFGSRNNGAVTRPAPMQGLGFEADKFDTTAIDHHLSVYMGKILENNAPGSATTGGLKMLHMDSWEMGAQNWTAHFRQEFIKRRGYDPLPFYPVYAGRIVGSREISERFLWDLRQTSQELVLAYHAGHVKAYAHAHGMGLSIEPYDMNPTADLELGSVADIPMGEFWSKGYGYNTSFSIIEAASLAHIEGVPVVQAESFTADGSEAWKQYPGSMKDQGDWALAAGINRFFYHTFAHKPQADSLRPGMNMGPYGVHWDRMQTWWPMADAYHRYIARCQFMLQQGRTVADVLYLTPEGAPQVFQPPASALDGDAFIPDRRGYNFDGCPPGLLYLAGVDHHQIVFPGGARYRLLVLPAVQTMTPRLLEKIKSLVAAGAIVVGTPPKKSPGLSGYPKCDQTVRDMASELWAKGKIISDSASGALYPNYEQTAAMLRKMGIPEDFTASASLRYTHRILKDEDIYFVANRTGDVVKAVCAFNTAIGAPQLWDPLTGETRPLPEFSVSDGRTNLSLRFDAYQSFFVVFLKGVTARTQGKNFPEVTTLSTFAGPWAVSFDTAWGGPAQTQFDSLSDWTTNTANGIRYYSGTAVYSKTFDMPAPANDKNGSRLYLDLGRVKDIAHVRLNGQDLGVVWTAPWKVDITDYVKAGANKVDISVANRWPNRLIGDDQPSAGKRFTSTSYDPYDKDSKLLPSGLLGPVTIEKAVF